MPTKFAFILIERLRKLSAINMRMSTITFDAMNSSYAIVCLYKTSIYKKANFFRLKVQLYLVKAKYILINVYSRKFGYIFVREDYRFALFQGV